MNDTLTQTIRDGYLQTLSYQGTARAFVAELDQRFDHIYADAVARYYRDPPWDIPGVTLAICCYLAWGEVRSVDVFTRQAVQLGFDRPRLRLLLSKQIYEEMVHHQMFRKAAIKMSGVDPLNITPPPAIMAMFDAYDRACESEDILEKIFYAQFSSERAVIPSFHRLHNSMQASKRGLHPLLKIAFERVFHDEPGHVGVGRIAAYELAERGEAQRRRMVEMALDIIGVTINLWITETKNLPMVVSLAGSLGVAVAASKFRAPSLTEFEEDAELLS